ncbi:hypothetical protein LKD70_14225 [Ruminococcus sp. CLA-AA-H200]|uniref:Guanylate cyclase domain-containing protein n=1 Tax=Ruminococcus turbiniformis TaxID=2881258 RepID=A0ABS8G008_9FIRM|nr:hypothetical protein [Ruminococcus turbiniformis]MCC2255557.1 hypothetical protein [Ruminococcus turbiniformis]
MAFEQYSDLFELKEQNFHRLDQGKATVIFLDCQGITKNHKDYKLMDKDPIYRIMADCAYNVAEDIQSTCIIYAGVDEASIIFRDVADLYNAFQMGDCADYVLSLFMQRFLKYFWEKYPNIYVKGTIFNLPTKDIQRYINYRHDVCRAVAMFYMAKEYLPKELYSQLEFAEESIKELLMEHGLYDELSENGAFLNGVCLDHKSEPRLSIIEEGLALRP